MAVILRHSLHWGIGNAGCGGYHVVCEQLSGEPAGAHSAGCLATGELVWLHFHMIARRRGTNAIWLPSVGVVETFDESEADQNHPYEEWLAMAIGTVKTGRENLAKEN